MPRERISPTVASMSLVPRANMYSPSRASRNDDMLGRNGVVAASWTAISSRYSGPNTIRRLWVPRPGCRPSGVTLNPRDEYESAAEDRLRTAMSTWSR